MPGKTGKKFPQNVNFRGQGVLYKIRIMSTPQTPRLYKKNIRYNSNSIIIYQLDIYWTFIRHVNKYSTYKSIRHLKITGIKKHINNDVS